MGFYKREGPELLHAPSFVTGAAFQLLAENHTQYTYPVDGWWWFETLDEALLALRVAPVSVTKRQAVQALILQGKDEQVETMLAAIPGIEGKLARAEWTQSNIIERDRPLVNQMGAALGMSPTDLDELFTLAGTL